MEQTNKFKILVCDKVSPKGIEFLKKYPEFDVVIIDKKLSENELINVIQDADAIIVRSETKITKPVIDSSSRLKAIVRAGVGVDNIAVEPATQKGIVVMNTPGGNTISTAELTIAMMLALARKIPQAHMSMKKGEWNRKAFEGVELRGKTLGILGLGRIGTEVAKRAIALEMKVIAYDPYISKTRASALQVQLVEKLEELLPHVDFLTIHLPKTEETTGLINLETMKKMKKGVYIINCARGGIIVEQDLIEAINAGFVAGAALDVYEIEPLPPDSPLRQHPHIIMTPHLGASTLEAQESVGIEAAELITGYLLHGIIKNAVNIPSIDQKTRQLIQPYINLGEKLGKVLAQLAPKRIERITITYGGRVRELPEDPITRAVLVGFLSRSAGMEVNYVNARNLADQLGVLIQEIKSSSEIDYYEWIHVAASANGEMWSVAGTIFTARNIPRIVRLNEYPVEVIPEGILLLVKNVDRPGMVGRIGTVLGKHGVNIANMSLHRDRFGGIALTVLNLDSIPPKEAVEELKSDPDIKDIRIVEL